MFKGFKSFLMRDDVITVAVGLVVALAFSNLVQAFTNSVINPLVARAQPDTSAAGLGWQLGETGNEATFLDIGKFISAIVYFVIFMAVVYFLIVVPYRHVQKRRGKSVFEDEEEPGTKVCPECVSEIDEGARRCKFCTSPQPAFTAT